MRYAVKKALDVLKIACKCDKPYKPRAIASPEGITIRGKEFEVLLETPMSTSKILELSTERLEMIQANNDITEDDLLVNSKESVEMLYNFNLTQELATLNAQEFSKSLQTVKVGIALDDTRPILTGVYLNGLDMVSVDGYRIITRQMQEEITPSFAMPHQVVELLSKLITKSTDTLYLWQDNDFVGIKVDNTLIAFKPLQGEYLKYERVFSDDKELAFKVNRKSLIKAITEVSKIPYYETDDKGNRKKISDQKKIAKKRPMILAFEDSLIGDYDLSVGLHKVELQEPKITIDNEYGTPKAYSNFKISFNPKYMLDALKNAYEDEDVEIRLLSNLMPITIIGSKSKSIVLPIRIQEGK